MEITLENMHAHDQLMIQTKNSRYKFSVMNPGERRGFLSGGSLGDKAREAILIGTLPAEGQDSQKDSEGLKTGARALFFLTARNGIERLITSVITRLSHNRADKDTRLAA